LPDEFAGAVFVPAVVLLAVVLDTPSSALAHMAKCLILAQKRQNYRLLHLCILGLGASRKP
jgi:hypothetical protein